MQIDQIFSFIVENREVLTTFVIALIAVIKLTAWGKAQAAALDAVVGIIERMGVREVKAAIARTETALPAAAKDALKDSVAKADPKKSPLSTAWRVVREVSRGL
ncbi:MAG: hypothetical protein GX139_01610 [Armatimonadetes bacterium]|jgi:hypothetical protein|nr:hypothetical protein [Armatimonadota bacterium]